MSGRAFSEGAQTRRSQAYRAVTPYVAPHERDPLNLWKSAYDSRFMRTSLQEMQKHTHEAFNQAHVTHAVKQSFFAQHTLPDVPWTDLTELSHQRSIAQKQPSYFGDVGGPARIGVHGKRFRSGIDSKAHCASLNLTSKSGRSFGMW
mmetsp:Transcript_25359/g.58971  ORF Transcript_25359/g.58971 Transcript_25359/m.58971 type:complete len:147 (+) Transcript_25359:60-500(+)